MSDLRDPRVDDAYRNTPRDEPPAEADERIRAAARRAVAARPTPVPERKRAPWQVPVSIAATVVLAVTVAVLVREEEGRPRADHPAPLAPPRTVSPAPAKQDSELRERSSAASAPPNEEKPKRPARQEKATPPPAAPSAPRAREEAQDMLASPPPEMPAADAPPPDASPSLRAAEAPPAAPADSAAGAAANEQPHPIIGPLGSPRTRAKAPKAADTPPLMRLDGVSPERPERGDRDTARAFSPARSPDEWLEAIRRLKAAGMTKEAEAELATFRRRYPDYSLPVDLQE